MYSARFTHSSQSSRALAVCLFVWSLVRLVSIVCMASGGGVRKPETWFWFIQCGHKSSSSRNKNNQYHLLSVSCTQFTKKFTNHQAPAPKSSHPPQIVWYLSDIHIYIHLYEIWLIKHCYTHCAQYYYYPCHNTYCSKTLTVEHVLPKKKLFQIS